MTVDGDSSLLYNVLSAFYIFTIISRDMSHRGKLDLMIHRSRSILVDTNISNINANTNTLISRVA